MSTKILKKANVVSVEIMQRSDQVTLSTSFGTVMTVETNQIRLAIGLVVAEALYNAMNNALLTSTIFDEKLELTLYECHG